MNTHGERPVIAPRLAADGLPDDHLYAAQAAADLLGIHRSTLYLAVRKLKLVPDAFTPGGHARFRRQTLQRFADRIAIESATGGEGLASRALASAVAALSSYTNLEDVCKTVVGAVRGVCPEMSMAISVATKSDTPRTGFQFLAAEGMSPQVATGYRLMRRRPGTDAITDLVAREQKPFVCGDVQAQNTGAPESALQLARSISMRSCAVFPCVFDGVTLGVLICAGATPCDFSEPEMVGLECLRDVLTGALRRARRDDAVQQQIRLIADLIRHAQTPTDLSPDEQLTLLRSICQHGTRARMLHEWGIETADLPPMPEGLLGLLAAAASDYAPKQAELVVEDEPAVVLVTPAFTAEGKSQRQAAVAGVWRRQDLRSGMELAVLQVYAQLYVTISARVE